ncbi:DUF1501 domain-containing protein [Chitinimonas sp.]|uniref:DUF1501 domain-containing protein n=1 Tax=Chitinimonas sp. TaxID=1934313 RepID=UPI0035AD8510
MMTRRNVLKSAAGLVMLQQMSRFEALAAPLAGNDFRALVCVFLMGGNDSNNMIIPTDAAGYAAYLAARGNSTTTSGALGLPQSSLVQLTGANYALHPNLAPLLPVWQQGKLALQFNVGTLVRPISKAEYRVGANQPDNLYSHSDQQGQWQTAVVKGPQRSGWAGRIADLGAASGVLPLAISTAGNQPFAAGLRSSGLAIPASGTFSLAGFGSSPQTNPLFKAMSALRGVDLANSQVAAAAGTMGGAVNASTALASVLSGTSTITSLFTGQNNSLAQQLQQVARIIEARQALGLGRQIFMVTHNGYDTHSDQLNKQGSLFKELGLALKSFYDAMAQLGVANQVTTFTNSDFSRTLKPNAGGSDHAWGGHHLVLGGGVKGGTYGTFPALVNGGVDDVTSQGRWLPTTSVDQYSATLASWFGVQDTDLPSVFPNLGAFPVRNLGFMA